MKTIISTVITILAKPYRCEPRGRYPAQIDADGTVRVWDAVAGHFTACHSLSARSQARIRSRAAALRGES